MQHLIDAIAVQKADLDQLRQRAPGGTRNFDHSQNVELTYTSNAIERNTLTAAETTLVIEQGLTVGGKKLRDHLEAIDHFEAIGYVRQVARQRAPLTEVDLRNLHRLVLLASGRGWQVHGGSRFSAGLKLALLSWVGMIPWMTTAA